jgi:transcriptional regulator with XRE-family HTH domain
MKTEGLVMNRGRNLGAELRKARLALQLTLRQVEARAGISNAYLSQLENGQAENPSPQYLEKLSEIYGINYESMLTSAGYLKRPGSANRDVFLSHRSTDKDFVRQLAADIEAETFGDRQLTVWLDEAEIRPGQSIPGLVNSGLETSRFVALVMSPAYFHTKTGWTDAEWHAALQNDPDNRRGHILPLLVQDCPYIPYLLRHLRAIDLRAQRYSDGLKELLDVLKDEPLPRPVTHRGQLIVSSTHLDRSTLIAERAVPDADPDVITERLYCNLLPVERLPRYIYMSPIAAGLMRSRKKSDQVLPSKSRLREVIRAAQEAEKVPPDRRFMPTFRLFEDKVFTFHDLEDSENPLAAITTENAVEVFDVATFTSDEDLRKILLSLMNMALSRHLIRGGLVADSTKNGRFFFSTNNGNAHTVTWTPRRKRATRTVAKPVTREDRVIYWRHLGAYVTATFLVNKFYVKVLPTWVITADGIHPSGGPTIARRVNRWTGPERNLQVLYHVRFWTTVLRGRKGGPINVWAGDQILEIAAVPAAIEVPYGILDDQRDLMRLLDEEAPVLAAEEEELADIALEEELDEDDIVTEIEADEESADHEVIEK